MQVSGFSALAACSCCSEVSRLGTGGVDTQERGCWHAGRHLQQVEAVDARHVDARDVAEGAHDAAVLAVHHERALARCVAPIAHLALAAADVAALARLLRVCSRPL